MIRNSILLLALWAVVPFVECRSADLVVSITDARGRPVPDAVVIAAAQRPPGPAAPAATPVVMDQVNKAFVPAVLVVRTGTSVVFPNSDTVAHQVYSFSATKRFELGLYRGHPHAPVVLDRAGLIVVGCNIHDNMVGYIVVTDSPHFGKSDARGVWRASALPAGEYELTMWSSLLPRDAGMIKKRVTVSETAARSAEFRLTQTVRASADASSDARVRDY